MTNGTELPRQVLTFLRCFFLFLGIVIAVPEAYASEPFLIESERFAVRSLSKHLSILIDQDHRFALEDIAQDSHDEDFKENRFPIASIGFTSAAVWARCKILNGCQDEVNVVVESSMSRLSHADWYLVQNGKVVKTVRCGVKDLAKGVTIADQYPKIEFSIAPKEEVSLYLCAQSDTAIWLPLVIGSANEFKSYERIRFIRELFLLSLCLSIFVISLFIGVSCQQRMYFGLAIVSLIFAMIFAVFNGHLRSLFPGMPIWFDRQFYGILTVLGLQGLIACDLAVFDFSRWPGFMTKLRRLIIVFFAMMLFGFLLLDYRVSSKYVFSLIGVGALVYALICAWVAISQRGWSSLILLLAWSVIAVNFKVVQFSQSYIEPNTIQSLLFPLVLALFLIRLIQNQISLSQTQVKLSNSLQAESEARLAALRSQLDPHFLFNLLTSIQVLSKFDPSKVPELVDRLAAFLRFRLSSSETPYRRLIDEVTATQAYLDIEKVRFGDQLKAQFDIQPETQDWQVPEMILQPLVENAIKHGFAVDKPVRLLIKARLLAGRLQLLVSNECHNTSNPEAEGGFGIGLSNTRDRLACLYGDRASLLVTESQNIFTANLQIPQIEQKTPPSDR